MTEIEQCEPVPPGEAWRAAEQLALRWLTTKRSPHTRFNYGLDLGVRLQRPGAGTIGEPGPAKAPAWLPFCRAAGVDPLDGVLEEHVALWVRGMEAAGLAKATVARKLAAVSSWYAWLARGGHVPANPAANLARPYVNLDVSKTPGLTKEQALALLGYADHAKTPAALRNAALAYLLIYTGARVSEVTGATIADLGTDREHRVLWVTRKGGSREPLVIPPPAVARLDEYYASRTDLARLPARRGEAAASSPPLIASAQGGRMSDADVWRVIRRLAAGAGLPRDLVRRTGAHSMRRTFVTLALDAGTPIRDLQNAMGHKDPRTTRRLADSAT